MIKQFTTSCKATILMLMAGLSFSVQAQNKTITCADLKTGLFHSYPKNSSDHYISNREGDSQNEVNVKTGDSILWKINWIDDCRYTLKFVSGNVKMNEDVSSFLKKHKMAYEISKVTINYYVFKTYIDKTSGLPIETDTMWITEKTNITSNELIKPVPNPAFLKKEHFSDTSKYAVVYIYRPGKFTNSLSNYLVYCNDNILWVARNKSGYIFKILKEGKIKFSSRLNKDESSIALDVKFGNTYYVKSMVHWGMYKGLSNYKLEMAEAEPKDGKIEFEEVEIQ